MELGNDQVGENWSSTERLRYFLQNNIWQPSQHPQGERNKQFYTTRTKTVAIFRSRYSSKSVKLYGWNNFHTLDNLTYGIIPVWSSQSSTANHITLLIEFIKLNYGTLVGYFHL